MDLLWENSIGAFVILTLVLGGGAALMTGRALAQSWRPASRAALYMLALGLAVRFFHYALAGGTLVSVRYYAIDTLILITFAVLAWRLTRAGQMVTQYPWLYRRSGPLSWTDQC